MSTAVARRYTYDDVRAFLGSRTKQISDVAGQALSPARVIQLAVLCCYQNRRLLECDQGSFLASVIQSCSLGIDLSPSSGEGYLIPYWNKNTECYQCRFQIGYQGLVKLACESTRVNYVHARIVNAYDDFEWRWAPELEVIHSLNRSGKKGHATHGYAVARLATGELLGECLTVEEIEHVRSCSQCPDGDTWIEHWDEMAKKTAARRLCKWLPKTPKLVEALETIDADFAWGNKRLENAPSAGLPIEIVTNIAEPVTAAAPPPPAEAAPAPAPPPPPTKTDRITARLAARAMTQTDGRAVPPLAPVVAPVVAPVLAPVATNGNGVVRGSHDPTHEADRRSPTAANAPRPARTSSAAASRREPAPSNPVMPTTGRDLDAFCVSNLCASWFVNYGKSRKFPTPITTWSNEQVKRAWEQYEYDIELGIRDPA